MAKKNQAPPVAVGDAFAVPLENGLFSACRVLRIGATGLSFAGDRYGVDFNPVPGALRIVGDNDEPRRHETGLRSHDTRVLE